MVKPVMLMLEIGPMHGKTGDGLSIVGFTPLAYRFSNFASTIYTIYIWDCLGH